MPTGPDPAWSAFWAGQRTGGGCLPGSSPELETAQRSVWTDFARRLPRNARVLDLATGDGRVLKWLLAARRDLKAVGIDLSDVLPPPPKGVQFRTGVAMETLPFPDGRFAVVVSQFGLEYADLPLALKELRRVLSTSGPIGLLTHRHDSPILQYSLARRNAIRWAIGEEALPEKAKQSLVLRAGVAGALPPLFEEAPARGAERFGASSAAWEIAEAIRRTLVWGTKASPAEVASAIDQIANQARFEVARIDSLELACAKLADERGFMAQLEDAGLTESSRTPVRERGAAIPFADFRVLVSS